MKRYTQRKLLFPLILSSCLALLGIGLPLSYADKAVDPCENCPFPKADEMLLKQISRGFSQVAKKAVPAVVYIESDTETKQQLPKRTKKGSSENPFDYFNDDFFNRFFGFPYDQEPKGKSGETVRGSGFFVKSDGYILTNYHVVENAAKIQVTLQNGVKTTATVVGTDPKTDLAVIRVEQKNQPILSFANSDQIEVGDWAIAVGNPFGLDASVTVGVISAKGRNQLHITDFEDFIQTDAAINPGNSGGPLLNIEGEVIGINTAIVSGSGGYMGIGFAIPSNMAKMVTEQLIKTGSVSRGFLGVTLQPIDPDLASFYKLDKVEGALVTEVIKGSPADAAGLKQEDIILKYNNVPVDNISSFRNNVSMMPAGNLLILQINRDGKLKELRVTIGSANDDENVANGLTIKKLGLEVQNLNDEISKKLNVGDEKGVVITKVQPGSPSQVAGLQPGGLIVAVNRKKINNIDEFNAALQESASNKEKRILLMIKQGQTVRFVTVNIE